VTPARKRIAIVGRNGQVSQALQAALGSEYDLITIGRPDADLCEPQGLKTAILAARPHIVANPAAYTAVDRAEDEPELAQTVNVFGAECVAEAAAQIGAPIIHFSTDYVFDGRKTTPYLETDAPNPLGVYGRTKLEGERRVARANPRHVILRTAWVYSATGSNFVRTMLRLSNERPSVRVVDDQFGTPTLADDLAEAVRRIIARLDVDPNQQDLYGVFHATSGGVTSWFHFAQAIMDGAGKRGAAHIPVHPIKAKDYPAKAARPTYSVLSSQKLKTAYGIELPDWQSALARCLDQCVDHSDGNNRREDRGGATR
jgi:dTDP-4-dehydrorhamnose reductase